MRGQHVDTRPNDVGAGYAAPMGDTTPFGEFSGYVDVKGKNLTAEGLARSEMQHQSIGPSKKTLLLLIMDNFRGKAWKFGGSARKFTQKTQEWDSNCIA